MLEIISENSISVIKELAKTNSINDEIDKLKDLFEKRKKSINELYENRKDRSPMTAALFKTGSRLSKNIGVDLNILNTFYQQSEFNIPILTLMENAGNGMLEFITSGDIDLMRGFVKTFGIFSIAREPIIELINQTE